MRHRHALYDVMFDGVKKDWDTHDDSCESLHWFWAAHRGGHTCLSDIADCDDCEVRFYVEGLAWVYEDRADEDTLRLCGCCARARGHGVEVTSFGLSKVE